MENTQKSRIIKNLSHKISSAIRVLNSLIGEQAKSVDEMEIDRYEVSVI